MSSADRLGRVTRLWAIALNAASIEESLYRFEDGAVLDADDRDRYRLVADFFQRALDGLNVMQALIEDTEPPHFVDRKSRIDDFRFAVRILPENVTTPAADLATHRDNARAFSEARATPEMVRPMRQIAQRLRELASSVTHEIRTGLA